MVVKSIPVLEESPWGLNCAYTAGLWLLSQSSMKLFSLPRKGITWRWDSRGWMEASHILNSSILAWFNKSLYRNIPSAGEYESTLLFPKTILYLVILVLPSVWEPPFSCSELPGPCNIPNLRDCGWEGTKPELCYWLLGLWSWGNPCHSIIPVCSQAAPPSQAVAPAFPLCRFTAKSVLSSVHFVHFGVQLCFVLIGLCLEASVVNWTVFLTSTWTSAAENIPSHPPCIKQKYLQNLVFKVLFTGRLWKIVIVLLI